MTDRRDFMAGMACLGGLAAAEWLRPRKHVIYLPQGTELASLIPMAFAGWDGSSSGDIVIPRTEGSLASKLYAEQVARIYRREGDNAGQVMLSVAYGQEQSDSLQLHRPEACYPAVGFNVTPSRPVSVARPGLPPIPCVALTATSQARTEDIVYWTRLGSAFPRTSSEQRSARLEAALAGEIPDGVLVRASAVRDDPTADLFGLVSDFLGALATSLPGAGRRALLANA